MQKKWKIVAFYAKLQLNNLRILTQKQQNRRMHSF